MEHYKTKQPTKKLKKEKKQIKKKELLKKAP